MTRILSRTAFAPFQEDFMAKINGLLEDNHSQWYLKSVKVYPQNTFLQVCVSFYTIDNLWYMKLYSVDYGGTLIDVQESSLERRSGRSYPFKDDFFVSFDVDPYFKEFLDTVVIETQKKRTAYIVSNKIRKELCAAAWHPRRVAAWLEAGCALEDL